MPRHRLIVILGPTAVGKTELSIKLAGQMGTEIISGDSMLVYRGFDIGSAKPSPDERQGIVHHLIDIREPWESYNVVDFKEEAERIIAELDDGGKLPILAGGTGLYVKSLLEGYRFNERAADEGYRHHLEELAKLHGREHVHAMLAEADPEAAARLHVHDLRRVIRALEVAASGKESISREKSLEKEGTLVYDAYVIGLRRERQRLYERIDRRVDLMVSQGLFEETRALLDRGVTVDMQAMQGIGYREAAAFLEGRMSREEAVQQIKSSTRHFAKRQFTWYRKMPYIHWYDIDDLSGQELFSLVMGDVEGYFSHA
ncbi:MAG: tRNA (adenosine(37)-N6)-dimethylallyltransferase MiaA [Selenomonadaceae bacterium]|nr:tRNA (adenosine(37)-N6)-dimethylallyltransferase MiaA [Selenomonadaceae bacterium]